jgi:hypothetical protein
MLLISGAGHTESSYELSSSSVPTGQVERADSGVLALDRVSFSPSTRLLLLLLLLLFDRIDGVDPSTAFVANALRGCSRRIEKHRRHLLY